MAWIKVKPEVLVWIPFISSQTFSVTCFATSECVDWITGNTPFTWASIASYFVSIFFSFSGVAAVSVFTVEPKNSLSSSQRVLTPSIIFWTSSTSEYPSLCLLEMSYVWPVWPPDSPLVPRGCSCNSSHRAFSLSTPCFVQPGRSTWTEALMPVPRLVGHEWIYPYFWSRQNSLPDSFLIESPTASMPLASLSNTPLTSPPFCIDMILSWSSSLTQIRNVLSALWKIPRPSGQSLSIPATVRFLSPETNKKWSSTSCWRTASSMPRSG